MTYNITQRLSDPTIASKVELITYLIERLQAQQSNEIFERDIQQFLEEKENVSDHHYLLIGPEYSFGCLIGHFIASFIKVEDLPLQMNLLEQLLVNVHGFGTSENTLLEITTAQKLIDLLTELGIDTVFRNKENQPLRIYHIPFEHKEINAYYYPELNSIASFRNKKDDGGTPEFVFMHEMGRLVAHRITDDYGDIPYSFIEFMNSFRPDGTEDLLEIFADLFSVTVMMDTEFAPTHPLLPHLSAGDLKQIREYFTQVINTELLKRVG
jgi:hypothetical protein